MLSTSQSAQHEQAANVALAANVLFIYQCRVNWQYNKGAWGH
jgi:hypothetical protein